MWSLAGSLSRNDILLEWTFLPCTSRLPVSAGDVTGKSRPSSRSLNCSESISERAEDVSDISTFCRRCILDVDVCNYVWWKRGQKAKGIPITELTFQYPLRYYRI